MVLKAREVLDEQTESLKRLRSRAGIVVSGIGLIFDLIERQDRRSGPIIAQVLVADRLAFEKCLDQTEHLLDNSNIISFDPYKKHTSPCECLKDTVSSISMMLAAFAHSKALTPYNDQAAFAKDIDSLVFADNPLEFKDLGSLNKDELETLSIAVRDQINSSIRKLKKSYQEMAFRLELDRTSSISQKTDVENSSCTQGKIKPRDLKRERGTWIFEAIHILKQNPEYTNRKLAKLVCVCPSNLSKSDMFKRAAQSIRDQGYIPKAGLFNVDENGTSSLDAYQYDDQIDVEF